MPTKTFPTTGATSSRVARPRHLLMCRPDHFEVSYSINPWMDPAKPVDRDLALLQWTILRETYLALGHRVDLIDPVEGLPDMVFAANGGIVHAGRAMAANFAHVERQAEGAAYLEWFRSAGLDPAVQASGINEGEGDVLTLGTIMLAGYGSRTAPASHQEIRDFFGVPVISLELIDPRFYHLDTALTVLDDSTIAYFPGAFSSESNDVLLQLFPGAVIATQEDADVFALNAFSDGHNVVMPAQATALQTRLRDHGFNPVGVDLSELLKSGGSAKCCTLEIRA